MIGKTANLAQIQRWMQSVITHPGGVDEGLGAPETRRHLDVPAAELESVIRPSQALASAARLEIYVNAYYERLLECLREEFTATRYAVGDELFDALAFGYLQHYPSRSYTLSRLGENFPAYLADTRLHAQAVPHGSEPSWPDFVIELAGFERLQREVFDSPGTEDRPLFDARQLTRISAADWPTLRLVAAPCLRLRTLAHPIHAYWNALKGGGRPSPPVARETFLAINRRDYAIERHELTGGQFALLASLCQGDALAEAIAAAVRATGGDGGTLERELREWFAQWTRLGFFVELRRPQAADE
jgi:hypothetical protein